jgi:thiamine biosynthesis lipoprotein
MHTVFHTMENFFRVFPRHGKSGGGRTTPWKTSPPALSCVPVFPVFLLKVLPSFLLVLLAGCSPGPRAAALHGRTMGTTYSIRIARPPLTRRELRVLQADVDAALDELNRQMSAWRPDSEISRFNRAGVNEPIAVSPDFRLVVRRALEIAAATDGALDPTVGALVNLWGFGPDGLRRDIPSPGDIAAARKTTGWRHLTLSPDGRLSKAIPGLQLDLGAVAKGHGVDRVAALLRDRGLEHFLVEIGGETLAEGLNADGEPWRVGVLRPDVERMLSSVANPVGTGHDPNSPAPSGRGYSKTENAHAPCDSMLHGVVRLTGGRAVATSGDYRQFFRDAEGRIRSHIIDPRTAAPADHAVASVSVLAPDGLTADALATALLVLGPDEGLHRLRRNFPGIEALFILHSPDGGFEEAATRAFVSAARYQPGE